MAHYSFSQHIEAKTRWPTFSRRHFQMDLLKWKLFYFDSNLKYVPKGPIDNNPAFGSDDGLVPNRWQAIIWTKDGLVYASLGLNGLPHRLLGHVPLSIYDDKSTLCQKMTWWHQATNHYLSQCWPIFMSPYGVTRPQWVEEKIPTWLIKL